jgi:hypothetical protein
MHRVWITTAAFSMVPRSVDTSGDDGFMEPAVLPPDILAVIDYLADMASRSTARRVDALESDGFKSELMLRTSRWRRDRVPPAAFSEACIAAGLRPKDAAKLEGFLRKRQAGKRLVQRATHYRKGWTFDGVIRAAGLSPDDDLDLGESSEDW